MMKASSANLVSQKPAGFAARRATSQLKARPLQQRNDPTAPKSQGAESIESRRISRIFSLELQQLSLTRSGTLSAPLLPIVVQYQTKSALFWLQKQ
jgi:hypothetical protein